VGKDSCTELRGRPEDDINTESFPGANELQLHVIKQLRQSAEIYNIATPERFEAQELATNAGIVESLADDHWIQELQTWESIVWAGHQLDIADYAIGATVRNPSAEKLILPPSTSEEKRLCKMQKMRKPGGFVNINVFGLVFTVAVATTIVICDLVLLRFLIYIRKYIAPLAPRLDRWFQDGIYQLQRRAHEAQGMLNNLLNFRERD